MFSILIAMCLIWGQGYTGLNFRPFLFHIDIINIIGMPMKPQVSPQTSAIGNADPHILGIPCTSQQLRVASSISELYSI